MSQNIGGRRHVSPRPLLDYIAGPGLDDFHGLGRRIVGAYRERGPILPTACRHDGLRLAPDLLRTQPVTGVTAVSRPMTVSRAGCSTLTSRSTGRRTTNRIASNRWVIS